MSPKSDSTKNRGEMDQSEGNPDPGEPILSLEDKLFLIDQEIRTLHQFCINQGYNPWEIEKKAQPILGAIKSARRRQHLGWLWKVAILVAVVAAVAYWDPAYRAISSYGRRASISVLPYWDWTYYYHEDCLIRNPYFHGMALKEEDCEVCETLEEIKKIQNVSQTIMAEDFLKRDIPVIVTDGMKGWEAKSKFTIHFLHQLYDHEASLSKVMPCMFGSNVRGKYASAKMMLRKGTRGEISNWYAHWENCEKQAGKFMRQFYQRPYFVPPMVEMAETNWVFVASNYKAKRPKPADVALPMVLYGQIKGDTKIELTPRAPCNETCPKLYATLHEGEILVLTDMMWILDYMPLGSPETIAVALGGYFD